VSLAVQKFMTDTLSEVIGVVPGKPATTLQSKNKEQRLPLHLHDVVSALKEMRVRIHKPLYLPDKPAS
jgi:hypothetical protein